MRGKYRPKSKYILPKWEALVALERLGKDKYYIADIPGQPDYVQIKRKPLRSERQKKAILQSETVCMFREVMRVAKEEYNDVRGHAIWQERYDTWVAKQKKSHNPALINKETDKSLSNLWYFVRTAIHYMAKNKMVDSEFPKRFKV